MIFKTREEALNALRAIATSMAAAEVQAAEISIDYNVSQKEFARFLNDAINEIMLNKIREIVDELQNGKEGQE